MEFKIETYHRNTSKEELINDVKRVAKELNKQTVTISEYETTGKYHPSTLTRKFGSWYTVLEMAGLEDSRSRLNISNEELFQNIESIWVHFGRQPKYDEIKKPLSKFSAGTYENRFGTWMKALEEFVRYMNSEVQEIESTPTMEENFHTLDEIKPQKHKTKREISERLRFRILMRDGFSCKSCGRSPVKELGVELHVDHIIPWSKGGETVPDNLETKCEKCNLGKGNAFNV